MYREDVWFSSRSLEGVSSENPETVIILFDRSVPCHVWFYPAAFHDCHLPEYVVDLDDAA